MNIFIRKFLFALGIGLLWVGLATGAAQAQTAYPMLDAGELTTDSRYAFGGYSPEGIDYLGIPIYRRWGENGNIDAQAALDRGARSYFVVGKIDIPAYVNANRGLDFLVTGPRCRRSTADDTIVPCVEVPETGIPNHPDWEQISTLAAEYPGQIWEIANEPDWHPYFTPEAYAVWYHLYEQRIRSEDPTAQIMIGGLLMCCGEGAYENFQINRRSWDEQIAAAGTRNAWTVRFWNHHRTLYGDYPRVDIWNIHVYAQAVGHGEFIAETKAQSAIARIQGFLAFLPTLPPPAGSPPEQSKPLFLTEVGILGPLGSLTQQTPCAQRGCLTQAEFESEESQAIAFMNYLLDWLEAEPRITRWYWFHWDWAPNHTINHVVNLNTFQNALHSFFEDIDEPNLAAINYAKRAGSPILYNRSFEVQTVAGAPYAWGFWAGGPGDDYAYGTTTAASHTGVQSLHIRVGAQAGEFGNVASARQPIYSQHYNGKLARVEAWCQTTSPTQAAIKVNPTGVNGIRNTNWTPGLSEAATCPDWQKIHTGWFILPHDTLSFEVELVGTGGPGEVWFDNVELVLAGDLNRSLAITADDLELLAEQRIGWNDIEPTLLSESEFPAEEWTSVLNYMRDAAQSLAARVIEQPE